MKLRLLFMSFLALIAGFAGAQDNPDVCQDFRYFLSNNSGGGSDIYGIDIVEGEGQMTLLKSFDYPTHIAYNTSDELLYVVNAANGSFRTLDISVVDGALSDETALDMPKGGSVAVAIDNDGTLIIGSNDADEIYRVQPDGSLSLYSAADVNGGDLIVRENGQFVLATRSGGYLKEIGMGEDPNQVIGEVANDVTGLALTETGDFLFSAAGEVALEGRSADGSDNGISIPLFLNESPFTLAAGDLTSACFDAPPVEGDCDNFKYFYVNHGPGVSGSDLYSYELVGNAAELTHLLDINYETHIGYNAEEDIVYLVNANGNFVEFYDVAAGEVIGSVNIDADITQLYAVVFNPENGLLYVGDANNDEVYTIDPSTGSTNFFADAPVQGGDLVLQAGNLYLAKRNSNDLFTLVADADGIADGDSEATLIGSIPDETNGMAAANNETSLICARFGTTVFAEISNVDGTLLNEYTIWLDGAPFEIRHGDMASGCGDDEGFEECAYQLYYTHQGPGQNGYALWEVSLNDDNTASYAELQSNIGGAHIALSPFGNELYIVSGSNVRTYDLNTNTIVNDVNIATGGGQNLSGFPSAVCGEDGVLYAGDDGADQVYTIDPVTGLATAFGPNVPLNGGDLIFVAGELWSIHRGDNKAYLVSDGGATSFDIPVNQMNGAAVLDNGNILVADGGTMLFKELDISDQNNVSVVAEYNTGVALNNGDLAGQCIGINPFNPNNQGQCYATELIEYVEGSSSNGGNIAQNRTDANQALGEPERIDQLVFVSLGYGGSLTLAFDGTVANIEGDDLEIVETTYGNNSCNSYPEFADVYVSNNGQQFFFAETICRADNFVDISSAQGNLPFITHVKIVNNDELSTTPDAFDIDGAVALANCDFVEEEEEGEEAGMLAQENSNNVVALSAYPNPSVGQSTVTFEMNTSERATLELYDMNGRVVAEIFNQVANANQEYRFDFNATNLPEGVYIYRLTTQNSVTVEKFILSK